MYITINNHTTLFYDLSITRFTLFTIFLVTLFLMHHKGADVTDYRMNDDAVPE